MYIYIIYIYIVNIYYITDIMIYYVYKNNDTVNDVVLVKSSLETSVIPSFNCLVQRDSQKKTGGAKG